MQKGRTIQVSDQRREKRWSKGRQKKVHKRQYCWMREVVKEAEDLQIEN